MKMCKSIVASLAAFAAAGALGTGALAQQGSSSGQGSQPGQSPSNSQGSGNQSSSSGQSQQQAPDGFVLIREEVVFLMADEPQNHFVRALQNLSQNDKQKAAAEVNIAAAYIDDISSRGQDQDKQSLTKSADKLRDLSKQIQDGSLNNPQQLHTEFAKANLALASHFQKTADKALGSNKEVKAGYQLRSAANAYQQALTWSNQSPNQQNTQIIQQTHQVAATLLRPSSQQGSGAQSGQSAQAGQQSGQSGQASGQDPKQVSSQLSSQIQQLQNQLAQGSGSGNSQNSGTAQDK